MREEIAKAFMESQYKITSLTVNTAEGETTYENFSVYQTVERALTLMHEHHPSWTSYVLTVVRK